MNTLRAVVGWVRGNWGWLKWPVALGVLAVLFGRHREGFTRLDWDRIGWPLLLAALAVNAAGVLLTHVRWFLLVWAQEFPFRIHDALRLGFIGYLFNYVAPGAVGGDLVKAAMIAREQTSRRAVAASTVLLDRVIGMLGLLIVGALATLLPTVIRAAGPYRPIVGAFWLGAACGLAGAVVALHPALPRARWLNRLIGLRWVGGIMQELINAFRLYQQRWPVLLVALACSLLNHLAIISSIYLCVLALAPPAPPPDLAAHLQFVPAAEVFSALIPLPAGTGALEGAVAYFYGVAGANPDDGFLAAVAYRLITILIAVAGAGYYFAARREIAEALDEPAEAHSVPRAPDRV